MLNFVDETEAIQEPKNARMEQRTKPHVKSKIRAAAALLGVDETAFVTSVAYREAQAVIEDHSRTKLARADADAVLTALDNPPASTDDLKRILELHKESVVNEK